MWKKLLSVIALVGVLSTATASAVNVTPVQRQVELIQNLEVDYAGIDPAKDEKAEISFDVPEKTKIYVIARNADNSVNLILVGGNPNNVIVEAGSVEADFYGTVDNTPNGAALPVGNYTVEVTAVSMVNLQVTDSATTSVRVESNTENAAAPRVTDFELDQAEFDARDGEAVGISFEITKDAFVAVAIEGSRGVVRTFEDFSGQNSAFRLTDENPIAFSWDGRDNDDEFVADGNYKVRVTVSNNDGANTYTETVRVGTRDGANAGVIRDLEVDPSRTWNPEKEDLEIEVELDDDVRRLLVRLECGKTIVEIADERYVDDNELTFTADGYDEDGDALRAGACKVVVIADADRAEYAVEVKYEDQEILEAFLSKDSFDPMQSELNYLILKSGVNSDVKVELFNGNQKEYTMTDLSLRKNRYYAIDINGLDRDGDELVAGKNWRLKITAENQVEDDIYAVEFVDLKVEDDEVTDRKVNVYQDTVSPVVFDDRETTEVDFDFCMDDEAEVTLEVFEDFSTSGNEEATLLDEVKFKKGCHTATWEFDKNLDNGVYTYKFVAESGAGRRETETGRFAVGTVGYIYEDEEGEDDDMVCPAGYVMEDGACERDDSDDEEVVPEPPVAGNCGGYWDTQSVDAETCEAIDWVTESGIFGGYADGSFGPYNVINRAEALKVILLATGAPIVPVNDRAGFVDVNSDSWYGPYLRTAKLDGIIEGYKTSRGQEARPDQTIIRTEFLKLALESAAKYQGLYIPAATGSNYADVKASDWFVDYAEMAYNYYLVNEHSNPNSGVSYLGVNDEVRRAEVALTLYRMFNEGLIK